MSLVAYRDLGLGIYMESRDWTLKVTEANDMIDGADVKVLAYDIGDKAELISCYEEKWNKAR